VAAQEVAQSVPTLSLHEAAIETLLASDARIKRNGFWADARALWNELCEAHGDYSEGFPKFDWKPDAYMIDRDRCRLVVYEVEDRWPLTRRKRSEMGQFWGVWDDMEFDGGWKPVFLIVNRFGVITHGLQGCDLLTEGIMQDAHDLRFPPKNNRYRQKFAALCSKCTK
jgi:hypothetical protein